MSGFSADWLALREPADRAARSTHVSDFVLRSLATQPAPVIVDLGSGTGSNVRYLWSRVPSGSRWRLLDDDAVLLREAGRRVAREVETVVSDLKYLERVALDGCHMLTASALLDLVAESWLRALIGRCREQRLPMLFALNYDGRIECTPTDVDDVFVRTLVNRHQRTDKGFGPALGPDSGVTADTLAREAGYDVCRAASDWVLGPAQRDLQTELIRGWAHAATEISPDDEPRIAGWKARRLAHLDDPSSRIVVGHDDVGAVWSETRQSG